MAEDDLGVAGRDTEVLHGRSDHVLLAEARVTLGVVAARQGDLEQVVPYAEQALQRKSMPSLMMVSRDLTKILKERCPPESATKPYLGQLRTITRNSELNQRRSS